MNAAADAGYVLTGVEAADLYVELFPERNVAALEGFHSGMHEASTEAAPVAPAPQPAPMPYPTDAQIEAVYEQTMGQHLRSQDAPAVRRFGRAMFLPEGGAK